MRGCLSLITSTTLVNRKAKGWVKASKRPRQEDPLSPFVFTIIADVLSRMMLRADESRLLDGFIVGRG